MVADIACHTVTSELANNRGKVPEAMAVFMTPAEARHFIHLHTIAYSLSSSFSC